MNVPQTELIFKLILDKGLSLNNNNVSLLQKFISYWAETTPNETISSFLYNWFKNVFIVYKQKNLNDSTCLVTIFLLEILCEESKRTADTNFLNAIFTKYVLPFHEIVISKYLKKSIYSTIDTDAVIAFFRLHCQLSNHSSGLELVKKYNLWKLLFKFFLENDKFNLFIQNTCTEYICNLISYKFPSDVGILLEVITCITRYVKSAIQEDNFKDRILTRSLRFLHFIFSKYLTQLDECLLHLVLKKCHSLESHLWQLATSCDDPVTVRYSLKTYVLFKCFLDVKNVKTDDIAKPFVTTVFKLVCENNKFESYMPEIFNISCGNSNFQMQLQNCASYLQITTLLVYLKQLAITVESEKINTQNVLTGEEFKEFFNIYELKLENEPQILNMVIRILKNISSTSECLSLNVRMYLMSSLISVLKSCEKQTKTCVHELFDVIINIIHALSAIVLTAPEVPEIRNAIQEILHISLISALNFQHQIIVRLTALNLSRFVLQKIRKISHENVELLKCTISNGLNDQSWEIRDSMLELLNVTLSDSFIWDESKPVISDQRVYESVVFALEDSESFVRTSVYYVLTTCISSSYKHLWESFLNYEKLLSHTVHNFRIETESNVKQRMIMFIHNAWFHFKILNSSLLMEIYETLYQAACNDIYCEVRYCGMFFWHSLIQHITNINAFCKKDIIQIIETLGSLGGLQAIVDGIEDEYDLETIITALNALRFLKSFELRPNDFIQPTTDNIHSQQDEYNLIQTYSELESLPNKLLMNNAKGVYIDAKTFISNYYHVDIDQLISNKLSEKKMYSN